MEKLAKCFEGQTHVQTTKIPKNMDKKGNKLKNIVVK